MQTSRKGSWGGEVGEIVGKKKKGQKQRRSQQVENHYESVRHLVKQLACLGDSDEFDDLVSFVAHKNINIKEMIDQDRERLHTKFLLLLYTSIHKFVISSRIAHSSNTVLNACKFVTCIYTNDTNRPILTD